MPTSDGGTGSSGNWSRRLQRAAPVIIVSSVTFSFISYWKTAAVVLCDLASTAYYIGGIVEQSIGAAAPWFILAVMCFSYAVRWVYIESCTLFVRGGVYRVVREALGRFFAKIAVSALMFDYILTGPISGVSAGQYIVGLILEIIARTAKVEIDKPTRDMWKACGSVLIAGGITWYFFRKNVVGIHESSDKALKIMVVTTIMAVIMLSWCGLTLFVQGSPNPAPQVPAAPQLMTRPNPTTGELEDPFGFLGKTSVAKNLRDVRVAKVEEAKDPGKEAHITIQDKEGKNQDFAVAPDARIERDGKTAKLKELNEGLTVDHVATEDGTITVLKAASQSGINWWSAIGLVGLFIAFGHSILAMSGEETLAQVYREVEAPKLKNFKKAAFIVFVYSLLLTGGISFLAVMLIPNGVRMADYSDNLIGGLAMSVWAPPWAQPWAPLLLNAFVVVVGFLILAGAVNTAIIGSNGVLNRVAEDGVMPDWFLKPHPRYGTTYRILYLIFGLQLFTIIASRGDVLKLGEAYAFGVIWSFVFQALAMVVLRFKDPRPREFKVPLNIRVGQYEVPIGLLIILGILLISAFMNLLTKETATIGGGLFTGIFFSIFWFSERHYEKRRQGARHEHLEQFNQQTSDEITADRLGLTKPYRKLVSIRSPQNLFMLEKALAETDPETTSIVVMTAKVTPAGEAPLTHVDIDTYDQQLMTAVVQRAERAGKQVKPLIVPTNNPLHAVLRTAKDLQAHELILGASNKFSVDEQLEQIAFYWINLHEGQTAPLTVRILSRDRDMYLDLGGGNRIPKISELKARSVAELRAAGVGVDRVLLVHDGSPASSDLFQGVLTMLDPEVTLALLPVVAEGQEPLNGHGVIHQDQKRAEQLGRHLQVYTLTGDLGPEAVRLAAEGQYDLIILPVLPDATASPASSALETQAHYIVQHAHCRVFLAPPPAIPQEVVDMG